MRAPQPRTKSGPASFPSYVYDLAALEAHVAAIRAALPSGVELLYAMKANPDAGILRTLATYVDGFEAASGGELRHLASVFPDAAPAALGGPGKTDLELTAGLDRRVRRFHVESPYELRRLSALAAGRGVIADVLLRVNLPVAVDGAVLVMGGAPTPFGMSPPDARTCLELDLPGVRIRGVHAHLASGLSAPAAASVARQIVEWAVPTLRAAEVNVGGGMAVDYADPSALSTGCAQCGCATGGAGRASTMFDWSAYGAALRDVLATHPDLVLRIEPGRALTAYCGWYVTEVLDVKRAGGAWFVVVAGGTHHLRTPAAKGHSQPFVVHRRPEWTPALPISRPATNGGSVTIVGQLCTPKDVLARAVDTGPIAVGDVIAFGMAGAYAWNISHHDFLMHTPPSFQTGKPEDMDRPAPVD